MGRPIRDVVYLDFTDETVPYHQENTIILPQWTGNSEDRALFDIIPFLESKKHLNVNVDRSRSKTN